LVYLIGRAAQRAGISPETARGYCRRGLLSPVRDSSGRRLFDNSDIRRLREIYLDNMSRRRGAQ
jgi:DNA-binding transcriptional MerR regulator